MTHGLFTVSHNLLLTMCTDYVNTRVLFTFFVSVQQANMPSKITRKRQKTQYSAAEVKDIILNDSDSDFSATSDIDDDNSDSSSINRIKLNESEPLILEAKIKCQAQVKLYMSRNPNI